MLKREQWIDLARELDWKRSYVAEPDVFPAAASGEPALSASVWASCGGTARSTFAESIGPSSDGVAPALRGGAMSGDPEVPGRAPYGRGAGDARAPQLDPGYRSALKLHAAGLPLTAFAGVVADLRAARFAHSAGWRTAAVASALDRLRRAQAPLLSLHERIVSDAQFESTHRLLLSEHWFAIAARHFLDDLLLAGDPVEVAVAAGFVFDGTFREVQAAALAGLAAAAGDGPVEAFVRAPEPFARNEQPIGRAVLEQLVARDRAHAQYLVDKWFWRSWPGFAIVTGSAVDYLAPLAQRGPSFKELVLASIAAPFLQRLADVGLCVPWYWPELLAGLDSYHHMAYASLYSYRWTLWFDPVLPGPPERHWLRAKYPRTWDGFDAVWTRVAERWNAAGPGVEWYTHGTAPVGLCNLCQLPLCAGTPQRNSACARVHDGRKHVFCSEPCAWIFEREPARYAGHRDLVTRCLAGEAPGNPIALVLRHFGLTRETWGRDAYGGQYAWLAQATSSSSAMPGPDARGGRT